GIRKQAKLVYELSEALDGLALGRSPSTVEVWRRLRDVSRGFEEGQQCDVQEFYMQVMSAVEELNNFATGDADVPYEAQDHYRHEVHRL
ncbi:hypothetical protein AAVH_21235, partial [Aphelenchoides avenae]